MHTFGRRTLDRVDRRFSGTKNEPLNHHWSNEPTCQTFVSCHFLSGNLVKIKASANGALTLLAIVNLHGGASPATLQVTSAHVFRQIVRVARELLRM